MTALVWDESDGSIAGALLHADGVGFDAFTIYDTAVLLWGDNADLLRDCVKPNARFTLELPNGDQKKFATVVAAKRAAERTQT